MCGLVTLAQYKQEAETKSDTKEQQFGLLKTYCTADSSGELKEMQQSNSIIIES